MNNMEQVMLKLAINGMEEKKKREEEANKLSWDD